MKVVCRNIAAQYSRCFRSIQNTTGWGIILKDAEGEGEPKKTHTEKSKFLVVGPLRWGGEGLNLKPLVNNDDYRP